MIRSAAVLVAASCLAVAASPSAPAQERVERTGSRLGGDSTQRMVYQFSASREVQRVLALIEQGETAEAVAYARDYLDSLSSAVTVNGTPISRERYSALNALCVALTKDGRADEAISTCSRAIDMAPRRWSALNSRATAYYASRQFERAAADYRRALEVAPDEEHIVGMLEHNIDLVEQRLAGADARP